MLRNLPILQIVGTLSFLLLINIIVKLWCARRHVRQLRKQGLPMPPHSLVWGHLHIAAKISKNIPRDAHSHYLADQIRQLYPDLGPVFYLDLWPFSDLMLIVTDPTVIAQFCQPDRLLPKHPGVKRFMYPMTGGYDLNCLDGETWKLWRKLFNPGFSAGHMLTLVPTIVREATGFRERMVHHAREADMFSFEEHALKVTIDVIGKVALDPDLDPDQGYTEMAAALLAQRQWAAFGFETDFFKIINPLRYLYIWNNTRKMDKYVNRELNKRYNNLEGKEKSKTIIDLALKGYAAEHDVQENQNLGIDPIFRKYALSQMKVFIFAGHDATASTICYAWLLLSRNPEAMAKLRAEHDNILGLDRSRAAATLSGNPALLNKLPYTLAVIKETLRLFPAVSSPRIGEPGFILTDSQGRQFPTEKCLVWANHHGVHRNPLWWPSATDFIPERFLTSQDGEDNETNLPTEFRPMKNAWRPFEFGPRACIGTELALAEIKIVLALTVRDFELEEAYDTWDSLRKSTEIKRVDGERVYQVQLGSAHPADGFPARVRWR